jgi:hypothetical protein
MKRIETRTSIPNFLMKHGLNKRICEVGVRYAYNLEQLLRAQPEILIGVDHYAVTDNPAQQDSGLSQQTLDALYREIFLRFLSEPTVKIYKGTSKDAAAAFPINWFDYVYCDDDHSKPGALDTMRNWWPRVRQGGIFAGHDYIDANAVNGVEFGVIPAVAEFMKEKDIPPEHFHATNVGYCTWMIYKMDGE